MLQQTLAVTLFNLQNLKERLGSSAVTVIGIGGVVLVFIGVLSIAAGFSKTLASTGSPEDVIVLRSGASAEMNSGLGLEDTRTILAAPQVARSEVGPVGSAELFVVIDLPKRTTGTPANVPLRGLEPAAFEVRQDFQILEGRRFESGRNEVIAGRAAADQFAGLEVGQELEVGKSMWTVVGIFTTGGTAEDTELWTDARVLQPAFRRGSSFQSVHARLTSADAFDAFKDTLTTDPRLNVDVMKKAEFYAQQSEAIKVFATGAGIILGVLMGIGAVFGALNTMYTAVSARNREIATLRALGFGAMPIVVSVLTEALVLALVGGALGGGLAYLFFNGYQASTLNFQSFSQVAFAFAVTFPLLVVGVGYALVMGLFGGFFPAIRAARLPVATALRQL